MQALHLLWLVVLLPVFFADFAFADDATDADDRAEEQSWQADSDVRVYIELLSGDIQIEGWERVSCAGCSEFYVFHCCLRKCASLKRIGPLLSRLVNRFGCRAADAKILREVAIEPEQRLGHQAAGEPMNQERTFALFAALPVQRVTNLQEHAA